MEFLDVVDDNDDVVGVASEKDIYEKRLIHRIVHVLIFNDRGEMALQLRSKDKPFCPNHWSTAVGGRVSSGESYEIAAIREYEEELGRADLIFPMFKDVYIDEAKDHKKFLMTFKAISNGPFNPNPEEVQRVEFCSIGKIKEMINDGEKFHPELLFLLRKHFGV